MKPKVYAPYGSIAYKTQYESKSTLEKRKEAEMWRQDLMHYVYGTGKWARLKREMLRKYHADKDYIGFVGMGANGHPYEVYELLPLARNGHALMPVEGQDNWHCQSCGLMGNDETFQIYNCYGQTKPKAKKRERNYGLEPKDADILVADIDLANYFENFVEVADKLEGTVLEQPTAPLSRACAKFVINELKAVCNRHNVSIQEIPIDVAAKMLVDRRARKIKNQEIKEAFDAMFKKH